MRALGLSVCAVLLAACTGSPAPPASSGSGAGGTDSPVPCAGDTVPGDDGCEPVGVPKSACAPGELPLEAGGCQPAGIPPDHCADGFTANAGGCSAILPASPCAAGTMAVPGDAACREVAPCADGDWGDIPVDATTVYVKADYAGPTSDGSAAQPWKTIQEAIDAAPPGGLVAVAAGTYLEGPTIEGKAVRLWGRCPSLVGIESGGNGLTIGAGADGSEVHGISVTASGWAAVAVAQSKGVLLERLYVHDGMVKRGLDLTGDTETTVRGSLVENIPVTAVMIWGATATLEASEVRDAHADMSGYGIIVSVDPTTGLGSSAIVRGSSISHNQRIGVFVSGSDAIVEGTVVRDTQPSPDGSEGYGILAQVDPDLFRRANLTVRASVLEHNSWMGLSVIGSDALIEDTAVRDTLPQAADQAGGVGIAIVDEPLLMEASSGTVRSSLVEDSRTVAVAVVGSAAVIESTLVRDTLPEASNQGFGHGLEVSVDDKTLLPASAEVRGSVFERSTEIGVSVWGSDLVIEDTAVRDTAPEPEQGRFGRGVSFQDSVAKNVGSSGTIRRSLVEGNAEVGVFSAGATLEIEATTIRDTRSDRGAGSLGGGLAIQSGDATGIQGKASISASRIEESQAFGLLIADSVVTVDDTVIATTSAQPDDGLFGDGVLVEAITHDASVHIHRTVVEGSWRAGLSSFGGEVLLGSSVLECNAIGLDSEVLGSRAASFEDLGGNACGCKGAPVVCAVMSASLNPPDPVSPQSQ